MPAYSRAGPTCRSQRERGRYQDGHTHPHPHSPSHSPSPHLTLTLTLTRNLTLSINLTDYSYLALTSPSPAPAPVPSPGPLHDRPALVTRAYVEAGLSASTSCTDPASGHRPIWVSGPHAQTPSTPHLHRDLRITAHQVHPHPPPQPIHTLAHPHACIPIRRMCYIVGRLWHLRRPFACGLMEGGRSSTRAGCRSGLATCGRRRHEVDRPPTPHPHRPPHARPRPLTLMFIHLTLAPNLLSALTLTLTPTQESGNPIKRVLLHASDQLPPQEADNLWAKYFESSS